MQNAQLVRVWLGIAFGDGLHRQVAIVTKVRSLDIGCSCITNTGNRTGSETSRGPVKLL